MRLYRVGHIFHGLLTSCLGTNCRARWREDEPIVSRRWGRRRPVVAFLAFRFGDLPKIDGKGILISLPSDGIKTRFHRSIGPPECEPEEEKQVCNFFSARLRRIKRVLLQVTIIASE